MGCTKVACAVRRPLTGKVLFVHLASNKGCPNAQTAGLGSPPIEGLELVSSRSRPTKANTSHACAAAKKEVYQGVYGPWTIEPEDRAEVYGYRAGLTIAAAAVLLGSQVALLPPDILADMQAWVQDNLDGICLLGMVGLGASLQLIHIYMAVMKRTLQMLWLLGLLGFIYVGLQEDTAVAVQVYRHPELVWLVGPMFASLTGVAFKEGLCYGKAEAAGLFGAVPLLMLGHLSGLANPEVERGLLAAFVVLFVTFAARKYTQPIKDDLGDKSIFQFLKLPTEEQEKLLQARNGPSP